MRYFPVDVFGIGAGYRSLDISGEIDNVRLDIQYSGAFLSAIVRL